MKTALTISPKKASKYIKSGGIVAFPTETVYGLGANIFNPHAIEKIFTAKKRPADNPLIAHVENLGQIELLATNICNSAEKLIKEFFPGPITLVLPKGEKIPAVATAGLDTIGVRMPRNDIAIEFLRECETPLAAPSANLSGKPSPTNWRAVYEDMFGKIDCILQGKTTEIGIESTVVDCTDEIPLVLRSGAVTIEELRKVIPNMRSYSSTYTQRPKSPGLKHLHYAPRARVVLVKTANIREAPGKKSAFIGFDQPDKAFDLVKICVSYQNYARTIYEFFRECDRNKIETVFCQEVNEEGIGAAIMDRIKRASKK